jgi:N-acetyl-anhydromuramyl-L-alanine amidase AmpD
MIVDRPAALGNFRTGRRARIALLVIHTMEGTLEGTAKWFATPDAMVSAHYGISVDGLVCRFVLDQDTAFHAGNADVNAVSLGIELEGHADDKDAFTVPMLDACAVLCNQLCAAYGISPDRKHIIGHSEVPDPRHPTQLGGAGHHRDPGPHFPWDDLLNRIDRRRMEVA